ncbi:MAG TPA: ThuA domain-containing protein [Pedobacter sp.]|nr:ThuA domain-containing protein [Pedobacter sp.]
MNHLKSLITGLLFLLSVNGFCQPVIYVNHVAYDKQGPKTAVVSFDQVVKPGLKFSLINLETQKADFNGTLKSPGSMEAWFPGKHYYAADFTALTKTGKYKVSINYQKKDYSSESFTIGKDALTNSTLGAIVQYYHKQRANTPEELAGDKKMLLYGSDKTVDVRGGWADASGDISKYFSHLAYANFMSPQQIPMVAWSMADACENIPGKLDELGIRDSLNSEALWGADYMMRSLSEEDYFYMTVFSYFKPDITARRIVGLDANSVTTDKYQCALREGGGMGIAALARISGLKKDGAFTAAQYLDAAKRAYAHLAVNNLKYTDDGKENIIDDYCGLMAATELWIATDSAYYKDEARKRAASLAKRMSPQGYFIADDKDRPFWHAADAGLPVIALCRYLSKEKEQGRRTVTLAVIKKALDYNLSVTAKVDNPFGYARQTFKHGDKIKEGFFIPHENETGWWWQGENARLASLATAAIVGGRLVYPAAGGWGVKPELASYAQQQLSWVLGQNPYNVCFMYGFGKNNVPYMKALFGHGSQKGGISNGITGKKENGDGSGIDFKIEDEGNEWRWTEQWIPHAGWFLQALTAITEQPAASEVVQKKPAFRVLALAEAGGHHIAFSNQARVWLDSVAVAEHFSIDYTTRTDQIDEAFLKQYQLILQLDYVPYGWKDKAAAAFEKYIDEGQGGWVGFHHATLLGEFDGFPMWNWFSDFMGGIRYVNYIGSFVSAEVNVEDRKHPVMKGVSSKFTIGKEEWYIYNKSPRPKVQVLASADESTYQPNSEVKMGDHPVVWTNTKVKARNVYIFMGHSPDLLLNKDWKLMVKNAILWASGK